MGSYLTVVGTMLSHYRRSPMQTLFLLVGLVAGVGLFTAVEVINDHARASYAEADQVLGANADYRILSSSRRVAVDTYLALRLAGFNTVYPVIETTQPLAGAGDTAFVTIVATDLIALPELGNTGSAGNPFSSEAWTSLVQPPYEAWYPRELATRLGINEGDRVALRGGQVLPPAVIRDRTGQGDRVFMDVGAVLDVLDRDAFTYLAISTIDEPELARLRSLLPAGYRVEPNTDAIDLASITASLHTNLAAMGLLSFAVGVFIVFNAVRFTLVSRQKTMTTLRELGAPDRSLAVAIGIEALLLSAIGAFLGVQVGELLAHQLMPAVAGSLKQLYGANLAAGVVVDWESYGFAALITLTGVALAVVLPLWLAARQPVLAARRQSPDWQPQRSASSRLGFAGSILLLLAFFTRPVAGTVEEGFAVIALALFGGALILPAILYGVARLMDHLTPRGSYLARWSIRDTLGQLPHLRIALMALLLSLTANLGVVTLVDSFRTALSDWLEVRLSATLYVRHEATAGVIAREPAWLTASHERHVANFRWRDRPASVVGLAVDAPDVTGLRLTEAGTGLPETWARGDANFILANEQVRYLAGVAAGDEVRLPTGRGNALFTVAGFIHDYGNTTYQFYLPAQLARDTWPQEARLVGTALWVVPGEEERAIADLVSAGMEPGDWIRQDEILDISFAIFDRTFAITSAMNSLTLLIAAVALFAALLAVHQQRLPDYALWQAMGLSHGEWLRVVGLPLAGMVLATCLTAVPLGYALSWLLIHQLNVIAFGWTMPLTWTWSPFFLLLAMTAVLVGVSFAVAAAQVYRRLPRALQALSGVGA